MLKWEPLWIRHKGHDMASISDNVRWDKPATVFDLDLSESGWKGSRFYESIAGAVSAFAEQTVEQQQRAEIWVDVGSVPGAASTILGPNELIELARMSASRLIDG